MVPTSQPALVRASSHVLSHFLFLCGRLVHGLAGCHTRWAPRLRIARTGLRAARPVSVGGGLAVAKSRHATAMMAASVVTVRFMAMLRGPLDGTARQRGEPVENHRIEDRGCA